MADQTIPVVEPAWLSRQNVRPSVAKLLPATVFFALADALALIAVYYAFALSLPSVPMDLSSARMFFEPGDPAVNAALAKFAVTAVMMLWLSDLYFRRTWEFEEGPRVLMATGTAVALGAMFLPETGFSHHPLLAFAVWSALALTLLCARMAIRSLPFVSRSLSTPMIVIGDGMETNELAGQLRESRAFRADILGQFTVSEFSRLIGNAPGVGVVGCAESFGHKLKDVTFVVTPSQSELAQVSGLLDRLAEANAGFMVSIPYYGLARRAVAVRKVLGGDVVFADVRERQPTAIALMMKRLIDFVGAIVALILLSPLLLLIAAMLWLESGPIVFSQKRVGRHRVRFGCLKFRTMIPNAEEELRRYLAENPAAREEWRRHQKLAEDPRVTSFGRFLRKTSLDELPQLFNVLKGEMSLVGPRPIIAPEVDGYTSDRRYYDSADFENYSRMRPGITGLWQVSGRASTTHNERIRLDRWYARNWSIWLDVLIVLKTVRAAVLGTGSV